MYQSIPNGSEWRGIGEVEPSNLIDRHLGVESDRAESIRFATPFLPTIWTPKTFLVLTSITIFVVIAWASG